MWIMQILEACVIPSGFESSWRRLRSLHRGNKFVSLHWVLICLLHLRVAHIGWGFIPIFIFSESHRAGANDVVDCLTKWMNSFLVHLILSLTMNVIYWDYASLVLNSNIPQRKRVKLAHFRKDSSNLKTLNGLAFFFLSGWNDIVSSTK